MQTREVDRPPHGTATARSERGFDVMGLLDADRPFVHESIIGTRFEGRVAGQTLVAETTAILPGIRGEAWVTGEHAFVIGPGDRAATASGCRL